MRARNLVVPATITAAILGAAAPSTAITSVRTHRSTAGARVVFASSSTVYKATTTDTGHPAKLLSAPAGYSLIKVAVSPSRKLLAAELIKSSREEVDGDGAGDLLLVSSMTKPKWRTLLTVQRDPSSHGIAGFGWAPSSKALYFGKLSDLGIDSRLEKITTAKVPSASAVKGTAGLTSPAVSPNGRTVVADDYRTTSLVSVALKTGQRTTLLNNTGGYGDAAYSPNGKTLAVEAYSGDNSQSDGSTLVTLAVDTAHAKPQNISTVDRSRAVRFYFQITWFSNHTLWFASESDATGVTNLVSVAKNNGTWATPVQRTHTRDALFSPSVG